MLRPPEEIDFFAKENAGRSACSGGEERFPSTAGIDMNAIWKINQCLLRQVVSSSAAERPIPVPLPTTWLLPAQPSIPITYPNSRSVDSASSATAPLTIFYRGTVAVFDLRQEKAEQLIKLAAEINGVQGDGGGGGGASSQGLAAKFNKQPLPMARKKSLQRFFEKRKERLTNSSDLYKK